MLTCKEKSSLSPFILIKIFIFLFFMQVSIFAATNCVGTTATCTYDNTANELAAQIQGTGITITNANLRKGSGSQVGIFTNGIAGAKLEIEEGIILTAMTVEESFTTNTSNSTSKNHPDITPDNDLLAIDNNARFDTVVLEFDVTLDANTRLLLIEFQFASEEYNEYVGSQFNDAFGFFLSSPYIGDFNQTYNIARVVDSSVKMTTDTIQSYPAVTVNNVNDGTLGSQDDGTPQDLTNSAYFIDNVGNDSTNDTPISSPINVEYDGLTHKLQAAVDNLTPGGTYRFKMALADTGDNQWDTGVFVSKIIGLREPSFCYDYSYSQNGKYFTEDNNGSKMPYIEGSILPNDDINVTIYLRNEETSEILAENITMDIFDINTSQAIYLRNSTYLVNTGEVVPLFIPDASISVSDSSITNIPYEDLDSKSYAYLYYGLTPSVPDINISLNAQIHYDVEFDIGGGNTISQHYDPILGSNKIPMCAGDNSKYEVDWGIFNVVSKGIYSYPSSMKYNLPTQVVRQPEEVMVIAHDESGTDLLSEINSTILIGVDLIDAGKFHSVKASCDEPDSAVSPILWMAFKDSPYIDLTQEIAAAITDDRLPTLSSVSDYYPQARQNAAYRISYITTNDVNESLVDTTESVNYPGYLVLNNFTELVQDIKTCKQPVRIDPDKPQTTTNVPVACSNAGNKGLSPSEYQRCMECLFGYNTKHICSRDNFAIRPESFNIKIKDLNQTNKTQKVSFATDRTGVLSPNTSKVNISAGYDYEFDINATTHTGNDSAPGYTRYFTTSSSDHNISFNWNSGLTTLTCNDITSKKLSFNVINGTVTNEANITNIGEYNLNMIDRGWTAVDWDNTKMIHHGGANGSYFVQGSDCLQNNSIVQNTGTIPSVTSGAITNANGCDISTNNHDNSDANLKYRDYNITAHPYKFNLTGLNISQGADLNNTLNSFIYTANVDDNNSRDMALHVRGVFEAQGWNDIPLSNFVTGCFAKDVNLTLDRTMEAIIEPYVARFTDRNSTNNIISDDTIEVNATNNLFTVFDGNFTKDRNGAIDMQLDLNYEKNITIPREPLKIVLKSFDVDCATTAECQFQADLRSDTNTTGTRALSDANLTHYYGRVHAPDYEFDDTTGTATILYEVYCKTCVQADYDISGLESPDSIYWYLNDLHVATGDGQVIAFESVDGVTFAGGGTSIATTIINNGSENQALTAPATPYVDKVTMAPDPWLLYNRFDNTALTNDFNVKFLSPNSGWAGEGHLGHTVDLNVSTIQNRRLDW